MRGLIYFKPVYDQFGYSLIELSFCCSLAMFVDCKAARQDAKHVAGRCGAHDGHGSR